MARAAGQYGAGFNCWNPVEQFVRHMMDKKGAANSRLFKSKQGGVKQSGQKPLDEIQKDWIALTRIQLELLPKG
jgi:hypothetical protein